MTPMSEIKPEDVEALIETFESSTWEELRLKVGDFELFVSKTSSAQGLPSHPPTHSHQSVDRVFGATHATAPAAPPHSDASSGGTSRDAGFPQHWVAVRAPNLGTFYRAPKPGAPPYVIVGQPVQANTEVCLIEVMKLFTTVLAGTDGVVRQVLVEDTELVEYDQPLILIEPD
jgi:acetyl-CoA carboxylase biotin carboxyl carrier protein